MRKAATQGRVTVTRDVPFHETPTGTLELDVYEPSSDGGPHPVVILVRGGGFTVGDKGEFARHALDLAADGYVAVEPQYRLAPSATFPAPVVDVKAAIEWVRAEGDRFGMDPQRIGLVGHSAGATLVATAGYTPNEPAFEPDAYPGVSSAVDAVVGYSGLYDFLALARQSDHGDDELDADYLGAPATADPDRAELASPVTHVDVDAPPTLLVHGRADDVLPSAQSELCYEVLDPVTDASLALLDGDHAIPFQGHHYDEVFRETATFLDSHVRSKL